MKRKLGTLALLYIVQGLPFGFQVTALPIYLRQQGVSLAGIGLASLLSLPWMIKVFWGPAVDRFGSRKFGRRRSWILPLQAALAVSCLIAASVLPGGELSLLVGVVLLMNLFASTMDVAVDGLAVDMLQAHELGYGNIAQVVGFKLGMLTGGGLLVWASGWIGWRGLFFSMAALIALAMVFTWRFNEQSVVSEPVAERPTMGEILRSLLATFRLPGAYWLLLFVATYKLGESMADAMFRPFLYDAGFQPQQLGFWLGTWGLGFSLAGSLLGGVLASRIRILWAVGWLALLRALAVGGEFWLSLVDPTSGRVATVIAVENLFGGALTPALFAYMMSRVDRRIGATHFTLLATVEVSGKLAAGTMSGFLAERLGYTSLFLIATLLALMFLALLWPMWRAEERLRRSAEVFVR